MSTPSDKDYIDARLLAATTQMVGDIKAANVAMDGRLATIEARIDGKIEAIGHQLTAQSADMKAQFAHMTAQTSARNTDNIKWIAATMITIAAVTMGYMTFLFNTAAPKPSPPPIVVFPPQAQVAGAAAVPPQAQPAPPAKP